jgi:hypothetical protein
MGADLMQLTRIGCFALLAAMMGAWISGEALARAEGRLHHARRSLYDAHATLPGNGDTNSSQTPMRYYGGPKSPMWH